MAIDSKKISPGRISTMAEGEVFVFGSNEGGFHTKGAAKTAKVFFGAKMKQATGLQGRSYGIPTKSAKMKVLSVSRIGKYVDDFIEYAIKNPQLTFLVTEIGCGLAGYDPEDIAPLFKAALPVENIKLPLSFLELLVK